MVHIPYVPYGCRERSSTVRNLRWLRGLMDEGAGECGVCG
jgi:hypothetical protein